LTLGSVPKGLKGKGCANIGGEGYFRINFMKLLNKIDGRAEKYGCVILMKNVILKRCLR